MIKVCPSIAYLFDWMMNAYHGTASKPRRSPRKASRQATKSRLSLNDHPGTNDDDGPLPPDIQSDDDSPTAIPLPSERVRSGEELVFPCFEGEPKYKHLFSDLQRVNLPNRPSFLPPLYLYVGTDDLPRHPLRTFDPKNDESARTLVVLQDTSMKGMLLQRKLALQCYIPRGRTEDFVAKGKRVSSPRKLNSLTFHRTVSTWSRRLVGVKGTLYRRRVRSCGI